MRHGILWSNYRSNLKPLRRTVYSKFIWYYDWINCVYMQWYVFYGYLFTSRVDECIGMCCEKCIIVVYVSFDNSGHCYCCSYCCSYTSRRSTRRRARRGTKNALIFLNI